MKLFTISDELKVLDDGEKKLSNSDSFISDTHYLQSKFNIQDKMEQATEEKAGMKLCRHLLTTKQVYYFFRPLRLVVVGILIKSSRLKALELHSPVFL